jgi:hypothetical protein
VVLSPEATLLAGLDGLAIDYASSTSAYKHGGDVTESNIETGLGLDDAGGWTIGSKIPTVSSFSLFIRGVAPTNVAATTDFMFSMLGASSADRYETYSRNTDGNLFHRVIKSGVANPSFANGASDLVNSTAFTVGVRFNAATGRIDESFNGGALTGATGPTGAITGLATIWPGKQFTGTAKFTTAGGSISEIVLVTSLVSDAQLQAGAPFA